MLLEVRDLHVYYGDIHALEGVSLNLDEGELVSVIGANGAGKSSLLNCIMGIVPAGGGEAIFDGNDITRVKAHDRAARGIRIVPERARVFPRLTVYENLLTGRFGSDGAGDLEEKFSWIYSLFPVLKERKTQPASTLSGGEQQMLAIARVLAGAPRLLLIDEPTEGLAPIIVDELFALIAALAREGTPIVLVEQNVHRAIQLTTRHYLIERGQVTFEGDSRVPSERDALLARISV